MRYVPPGPGLLDDLDAAVADRHGNAQHSGSGYGDRAIHAASKRSLVQVEKLVSGIRNAKYDDMVRHLEELIDSGLWQDYTTESGTRFQFRSHEFDYFLAAMGLDPALIKHAYDAASGRLEGMHAKQIRLHRDRKLADCLRAPPANSVRSQTRRSSVGKRPADRPA